MIGRSRLRGPIGRRGPYAVALFLSAAAIEAIFTGNPPFTTFAFGLFFIVMGISEFCRTKLVSYLVVGLLFGTGTWHSMARFMVPFLSLQTYIAHVIVVLVVLIFTWPVLYANEKLEANARKLFNLVAEHLHEAANGFTSRPYSACKTDATQEEIIGFSRFMRGKHIVESFVQENSVILTFSMGISPLKEPDLQQISYVSFDHDGNISVHISQKDYKRYKEEITFDRLCASLGDTFKRFLQYYKMGLESRIIVELKAGAK